MKDYTITWTMAHDGVRRTFTATIPAANVGRAWRAAAGFAWETVTATHGDWKIAAVDEPFTAVEALVGSDEYSDELARPGALPIFDETPIGGDGDLPF